MMKLEDMEDADPRYATTVEVADLRRTLDDFMKKQQQRNEAIKTKLDKIMYSMEKLGVQDDGRIEDQASKVKAKDLHDTPECQMQDPFYEEGMEKADWEDCPWSASELEAFYENAYQEWPLEPIKPPPVVTSYTPTSSTTNTFTAAPAKCSTDCSSQDKNAFPPRTVVLRKEEELHKESSTLIQAHVVLDDMHQRLKPGIYLQYMINSKGSSTAEMLGPCYKVVLKPALLAHAEENKRITVSNLAESVDLQKQVQGSAKILEEKKSKLSTLQAKHDKVDPNTGVAMYESDDIIQCSTPPTSRDRRLRPGSSPPSGTATNYCSQYFIITIYSKNVLRPQAEYL